MLYYIGMKVFRYMTQAELNNILLGNYEKIGSCIVRDKNFISNTHKYQKGVKYLHFFKNRKNIERIKEYYRSRTCDCYICEFNIPLSKLIFHSGLGYYNEGKGYDMYITSVVEFALPVEDFDKSYLVSYQKDKTFNNQNITSKRQTIDEKKSIKSCDDIDLSR